MSGSTQVGGISVPIFAVDHATAVIDRVGKNIAGLVQPTQRVSQATSQAGFGVLGINRLSQGMQSLGSRTRDTFRAMERIAPAIGAITGAVTLGGMLALENRFANIGQHVANLGQRLGIPVERLTELQGAARLGGVGAEDMSAGLTTLDEALRSATFRGDGLKIQAFNAIGVNFGEMGQQARTADAAIGDVAEGVKRLYETQGRGAALRVTQILGLEGLFPVLLRGKAGIDELRAKVARLGGVITPAMAGRAEKLREGFQSLTIAADGFANKLADAVSPQFTRLSEGFATWIANHAPRFSAWIGSLATRLENWIDKLDFTQLNQGIEGFFHWVDTLSKQDFSDFGQHIRNIGSDIGDVAKATADLVKSIEGMHFSDRFERTAALLKWIVQDIPGEAGDAVRGPWHGVPVPEPTPEPPDQRRWWERFYLPGPGIFDGFTLPSYMQPGSFDSPLYTPGGGYAPATFDQWRQWLFPDPVTLPLQPWLQEQSSLFAGRFFGARIGNSGGIAPNLDPRIEDEVRRDARLAGLDENHMVALFRQEHGGFYNVSPAGAFGPAQLMPGTAEKWGVATNVNAPNYDWRRNVFAGIEEYRQLFDHFGRYDVADAGYNAGPNNRGVRLFAQTGSEMGLPDETRNYIHAIQEMAPGSVHVTVDVKGHVVGARSTASGIATTSPVRITSPMPSAGSGGGGYMPELPALGR